MPKKIREIRKILRKAGFKSVPGKGSHEKWVHPLLENHIVVAGKDGSDAKAYLEKQVEQSLKSIKQKEGEE
ncbi:MAG: type II toxin-antitoxin system HicA family toxin [Cyanobacteria bacterium P01_A01_bin.116]